jgi:hypothetical protein
MSNQRCYRFRLLNVKSEDDIKSVTGEAARALILMSSAILIMSQSESIVAVCACFAKPHQHHDSMFLSTLSYLSTTELVHYLYLQVAMSQIS